MKLNLNKIILNTVTSITMLIAGLMFLAAPVQAEAECENPGPYGICVPDTDIAIGEVTLTTEMLAATSLVFAAGVALVVNGELIKKNIDTK